MADPMKIATGIPPGPAFDPAARPVTGADRAGEVGDFQSYLIDSLNEVNRLQNEADAGVQRLVTGEADNVAEVLSAIRKSEVAFSLLMEIRNKLLDAYSEIRQMRI
ncbi:MAG: flagellar hook-basal body complex protein FliE [Phycisphaerae bacterium]